MNGSTFEDDQFEDDLGYVPHLKNLPRGKKKGGKPSSRVLNRFEIAHHMDEMNVTEQQDQAFQMTYRAARYETGWLEDSLRHFFDQKWFDDVLRRVKGGKEASVYLCTGNETTGKEFLATKVYRPRRFRNLKNDWLYREGRANLDEHGNRITDAGQVHAMNKRTNYGRELLHTSWLEHEFTTLEILHEAGADVPRVYASGANAILMEYLGDEVIGAPTLNDVTLEPEEVRPLYDRVIQNIELMLANHRIHGDLSAFNILYWEGEISLIDFPQAIHPEENRSAYRIFERDVTRVCEYFQRQGVRCNPRKLATDMWEKYHLRFIPLVDPKVLGEDHDDDRTIWESLKNA